jgi:hypothetical protein
MPRSDVSTSPQERRGRLQRLVWVWSAGSVLAGTCVVLTLAVWKVAPVSQLQAAYVGFLAVAFLSVAGVLPDVGE